MYINLTFTANLELNDYNWLHTLKALFTNLKLKFRHPWRYGMWLTSLNRNISFPPHFNTQCLPPPLLDGIFLEHSILSYFILRLHSTCEGLSYLQYRKALKMKKGCKPIHCKCLPHENYGDWESQGPCRENLHYLCKRVVRIRKKHYVCCG